MKTIVQAKKRDANNNFISFIKQSALTHDLLMTRGFTLHAMRASFILQPGFFIFILKSLKAPKRSVNCIINEVDDASCLFFLPINRQ